MASNLPHLAPEEDWQLIQLQKRILAAAMGAGDARDIVEQICRLAESLLAESVATVLLLNMEGLLDVFAAPSVPPDAQAQLSGLQQGPEAGSCSNAVLRQEPVFVTDTLNDPRWRQLRPLAVDFDIMACWSMPIRNRQDKVIGTFALSSFVHRSPSPFHIQVLETAAAAVSLVLEHHNLQEKVQLQARSLEAISEGILLTGANEKVLWVNSAFTRVTGYTQNEMHGQYCTILQGDDARADTKASIRAALSKGEDFHGEILNYRKDGNSFWNELTISPVRNPDGEITHFVGVQRDITARKTAEQELRIAAKAFDVREGIMITDAKKRIIRVNKAFTRVTGYTPEEAIGRTPAILKSGRQDRLFYKAMWDSITGTGFWQGEIWNRRKNGEIYPEWLTISAVSDENGEVTHYVAYFSDISRRKAQEEKLQHMALHDVLTGLPNRAQFERSVSALLELVISAKENPLATSSDSGVSDRRASLPSDGTFLAVGVLDLDGFKEINDTLGHSAGDALLRHLAKHFQRIIRADEGMARLGGDEFGFALLLNDPEKLTTISQRLLAQVVAAAHTVTDTPVTGSLGWSVAPLDGSNYATLLAHADEAMYAAKAAGKSTYRIYGGAVQKAAERRIHVHRAVPRAISQGDFVFFLQPQADLVAGCIDGVEMLARWRQPDGRWLFPGKFMPIIEQDTHLARVIGIHALLEAHQLRNRMRAAGKNITISLNIGGKHFLHPDFLEDVAEFCPQGVGLMIEITESIALTDLKRARLVAEALNGRGFLLSMDDFGTGYSSLYHATQLPFDEIKLDQNFVRNLHHDYTSFAVAGATLLLAEISGKSLIAEGISNSRALETWLRMGGRRIQGYSLAPPLPEQSFLTWYDWFLPFARRPLQTLPLEDLPLLLHLAEDTKNILRWAHIPSDVCPVGRWLQRRRKNYGKIPEFQEFMAAHDRLHALAANGVGPELQESIAEIHRLSAQLLDRISEQENHHWEGDEYEP